MYRYQTFFPIKKNFMDFYISIRGFLPVSPVFFAYFLKGNQLNLSLNFSLFLKAKNGQYREKT